MIASAALLLTCLGFCGWPVVRISTALRTCCPCEVEHCGPLVSHRTFSDVSPKVSLADMSELGLASCLLLSWALLSYQPHPTHLVYILFLIWSVAPALCWMVFRVTCWIRDLQLSHSGIMVDFHFTNVAPFHENVKLFHCGCCFYSSQFIILRSISSGQVH